MKLVRMRYTIANDRWFRHEGQTVELEDAEADSLIKSRHAEEVKRSAKAQMSPADAGAQENVETASANAEGETAADGDQPDEKKPQTVMQKMQAAKAKK